MIVRLPEFNLALPTWAAVWAYARVAFMAAAAIVILVWLAHWRSNSRLDRDGLEQLAKGAVTAPSPSAKSKPAVR